MTKSIESAMRRGDIERFTVQVDGDIPQEGFKQRFFVELTDRRQRGSSGSAMQMRGMEPQQL